LWSCHTTKLNTGGIVSTRTKFQPQMNFSVFYVLQYHVLDRRHNRGEDLGVGDIGDVSDGQNDTPNRNRKKNDNDLLK